MLKIIYAKNVDVTDKESKIFLPVKGPLRCTVITRQYCQKQRCWSWTLFAQKKRFGKLGYLENKRTVVRSSGCTHCGRRELKTRLRPLRCDKMDTPVIVI